MIPFVEECRQVWRRLGVVDPVANEMAADLTVDLQEAEADGGSLEDVLGNSAFDPTGFATAWAVEKGLVRPAEALALPQPQAAGSGEAPPMPGRRRPPVAALLSGLAGIVALGFAVLLLGGGRTSASMAVAVRRLAGPPGPGGVVISGPRVFAHPGVFETRGVIGADLVPLALVLLLIGVVSVGAALWYWSPWSTGGLRRLHSREGSARG